VMFSWWVGNGDLHLKNLSLICDQPAGPRLCPAYDLVSTAVVIRGDKLALSVGGKKDKLSRKTWLTFGEYCGLPLKVVHKEIGELVRLLPRALKEVQRSFLSAELQEAYKSLLRQRTTILSEEAPSEGQRGKPA